jgi:hypothetical protein
MHATASSTSTALIAAIQAARISPSGTVALSDQMILMQEVLRFRSPGL